MISKRVKKKEGGPMNEKHLEFIQDIVNRMGGNSFALKGLSVTLITAIIGFSLSGAAPKNTAILALLPAIAFWALDAYYLRQERLFRELYKATIKSGKDTFSLDTSPYQKRVATWLRVMFSRTLVLFYGALIAAIIIVNYW
jgi:hypothetical protein